MPSFRNLPEDKKTALVEFLASLKAGPKPASAYGGRHRHAAAEHEVRAMFDRIAGVYDLMNTVMTAGLHHRWRDAGGRPGAASGPGTRALDVATGTGDLAIELARARRRDVVGSDFSEGMLERARAKAPGIDAGSRPTRWRSPTPTTRSTRRPWASARATSATSRAGSARWCASSGRAGGS